MELVNIPHVEAVLLAILHLDPNVVSHIFQLVLVNVARSQVHLEDNLALEFPRYQVAFLDHKVKVDNFLLEDGLESLAPFELPFHLENAVSLLFEQLVLERLFLL
jgi:hypothetical protein